MTPKEQAVQTAGERLEHLETWMRRTCIAATVSAALTAVLAAIAGYGAFEYIRLKNAMAEASAKFEEGMKKSFPSVPSPSPRPSLRKESFRGNSE